MELGTGIFLSSVFLGTIFLYVSTRDRWNWKKYFLWPLAGLFAVSLVFVGGWIAWIKYENRPAIKKELEGISLGQSLADVKFRVGKVERATTNELGYWPKYLAEIASEKNSEKYRIALRRFEKAKLRDAKEKASGTEDGLYVAGNLKIKIDDGRVESILVYCLESHGNSVNGIGCGSRGDEIIERLGKPYRVLCETDPWEFGNPSRAYDIAEFGTRYFLTSNRVDAIMIAEPSLLKTLEREGWGHCP
jgi:hypothetical protein